MAGQNTALSSQINQTYTSMSGCDINAYINNNIVGNIQGVSFSITREKAPIYVMGATDPISFSRGKRGIAGSLIFTNFDREVLYDIKNSKGADLKYHAKSNDIAAGGRTRKLGTEVQLGTTQLDANYSDQLPPFNIVLSGANESGHAMWMSIMGVELLNEGAGLSIDDIVNETQMTFVARSIIPWQPQENGDKPVTLSGAGGKIDEQLKKTQVGRTLNNFIKI